LACLNRQCVIPESQIAPVHRRVLPVACEPAYSMT
jgi:hypothetical protein